MRGSHAHIVHHDFFRRHRDAQVARTAQNDTAFISIFYRTSSAAPGITGLGNFLVHNAVKLLPGIEMVIPMKDDVVETLYPPCDLPIHENSSRRRRTEDRQLHQAGPAGLIRLTLTRKNAQAHFLIRNTTLPSLTLDEKLLFTRFYRGDSSRSRQIEGVGLGLSLAREIVHAHHGSLTLAESKEGWVSFALMLPIQA